LIPFWGYDFYFRIPVNFVGWLIIVSLTLFEFHRLNILLSLFIVSIAVTVDNGLIGGFDPCMVGGFGNIIGSFIDLVGWMIYIHFARSLSLSCFIARLVDWFMLIYLIIIYSIGSCINNSSINSDIELS
jgi:hypothetical protein